MFRLLTILLVLYCSSKVDEALGAVLPESGQLLANRPSLILGGGNAERKDASVNEEETTPEIEPSLYARGPKDDKGKGKMTDDKGKGKAIVIGSAKRSRDSSDSSSTDRSFEDPRLFNTMPMNPPTPTSRAKSPSPGSQMEIAECMVEDVRSILAEEHSDPYSDEDLAELISEAINQYNKAFGREFRDVGQFDEDYINRVYCLMNELLDIYKDIEIGKINKQKQAELAAAKGKGKMVALPSKKRSPSSKGPDPSSKRQPPPPPPSPKRRRSNSV